jgi:hypothetical protein
VGRQASHHQPPAREPQPPQQPPALQPLALRGMTGSTLLAACLLSASSAHAEIDRKALTRLGRSVLRIEAVDGSGRVQLGSGVIVSGEQVVTNCHVTRNARTVTVIQGSVRAVAQPLSVDFERDVCVLRVPDLLKPLVVPIAHSGALRQGQELVALGYTGGAGLQISGGSVVALHRWAGSYVIQCSNGFTSGASGGGLFDNNGALVGILTFRLRGGKAHYYATPADWLLDAATGALRFGQAPRRGRSAFWEVAESARPAFLQAAALEQAGDWAALERLAGDWARDSVDDPEPFYMQAVAAEGLGRDEPAIEAWQQSLAIDPDYSRSWARLARLYHRMGRASEAQHAITELMVRDPGLAIEVSTELKAGQIDGHEDGRR